MQTAVIYHDQNLIEVSNYEMQNVQAIISPNLMFINRPVEVKNQRYYRLIIWFDYKPLIRSLTFKKDLVLQDFQFELYAKTNNTLEKLNSNDSETLSYLTLSFDDQQRRVIFGAENYLIYLVNEKFLENNQFNFNYSLKFKSANYLEFLNQNQLGVNRGKIQINLQSQLNNNLVEVPEVLAYLENDSWKQTSQVTYQILFKRYYLTLGHLNYVNEAPILLLKINFEIQKQLPLAILSQQFLKEIIYDLEQNFLSDDLIINQLELKADEKLNAYYEPEVLKLNYQLIKKLTSLEIYLNNKQTFNPDLKKVVSTDQEKLIFNPLVQANQWIELNLSLSNKPFKLKLFINDNHQLKLVEQARDLNYQFSQTFNFNLENPLSYFEYLGTINED